MKKIKLLTLLFILPLLLMAQSPVTIGDTMTNFTLKTYDNKTVSLSDYKGKNVMLVFPRGKVDEHWCQLCHYQYAELAELEKELHFQQKYNLTVLIILPYNEDLVKKWIAMFPDQLAQIEKWKHPDNVQNLTQNEKRRFNFWLQLFPKQIPSPVVDGRVPFPVLIDSDRELSMKLGIFTTFWDRSYVEQNISSIFILDKAGIVKFKYVSQSTIDRPKPEYLFKVIEKMVIE
jgi:peroxiredoxin